MKFYCDTQLLNSACQNIQRAVSTKTTMPALEGILIKAIGDELELTAYDLEVGIITRIPSRNIESGMIILNARILCDIVRRIPADTVYFECDNRLLATIRGGETEYSLVGMNGDDYPELPSVSGGFPVVMKSHVLKTMIRQTAYAAAKNDVKVVHTGVKFEVAPGLITLVAVDGSRLAVRKEVTDYSGESLDFVVPVGTLKNVTALLSDDEEETVNLGVGKRHIIIEVGNYTVVSRLLDGEFLNYKNAIPASFSAHAVVDVNDMIDCIERASTVITEKFKTPLRFIFDGNQIRVSSVTANGTANDSIDCEYEGGRIEIGFNNALLLDALHASGVDKIKIELNGQNAPIIMQGLDDDRFIFLILPMRFKRD